MNLTNYLSWHYFYAPRRLPVIWHNFLDFVWHFFSIKELFAHLFSPWKRLTLKKGAGFNLEEFIRVNSFNLVSRAMGGLARLSIIFAGLLVFLILLTSAPFFWLAWFFLPGLTYPLYRSLKRTETIPKGLQQKNILPAKIFKEFLETPRGKFFQSRLALNLVALTSDSFGSPETLTTTESFNNWSSLIISLAEEWSPFKKILKEAQLDKIDVQKVLNWYEERVNERQESLRFWWQENLSKIKPLGRDLIFGYTLNLDKYTTDLTTPLPYSHHLVGRQKEARMIEQVLSRSSGNNLFLIGEPGVGRTTIVLNFARMVAEAKVNPVLARKRVLELNLNSLVASSQTPQEAKAQVEMVLDEAVQAGNIILVIKHIDLYLASGSPAGERIDLSEVLVKPAAGDSLQIIGVTTPADFQKYLYPNREVSKYFEKVEVSPPTKEEAYLILEKVSPVFEARTKTFITYQAIKQAIEKADQYLTDLPFPEKAIDLLDEVCVNVALSHATSKVACLNGLRIISKEDVDQLLSEKTKIPVGEISKTEKEKLINLEAVLHERIIDQEEAVLNIAKAMRRARTGISSKNRPIGTFLFLGPTGVGKTETAKALASAYFGSEQRMIRFDMAEYQTPDALDKAIGDQKTKEPGLFAKAIRENPFSLLLIDEVEKAHPKLLNLFLTILDEGYFSDAFGRKVDCRNLIIIATSNAGAEFIRQKLSLNTSDGVLSLPKDSSEVNEFSKQVTEFVLRQGIFSPEFINRFDSVVVFKPLTSEHLEKIAELMLKNLNQRLAEKECSIKITPELIKKVAELGYEPEFGARPMNRVIQDKIEDQIAQKLLKGEIKKGEEIEVKI